MYTRTIVLDSCVSNNEDIIDAVSYIQNRYRNIDVFLVNTNSVNLQNDFKLINSVSDLINEMNIDKSCTLITCSDDNYKNWVKKNGKGVICSKKGTNFSPDCIYLRNYDKIQIGKDIKKIIHLK